MDLDDVPKMQNGNPSVTFEQILREACTPPSRLSTWRWIEENVYLDPTMSDFSGKVRFDFFPASKIFFNHLDNPRLRKSTVMKCSQSGFTENAIMYVERRIKENPVTTMWVGANAQKTEEDAKKRIWPAIENCPVVAELSPPPEDRERWTKRLIMFDSMNLMIRGSESRMALQGDPAGLIICDERREWKPGRIHLLRKRTRSKMAPLEISIGAAGKKGDELHADWLEGSQTFIHFTCPKCNHSQPWRFGKDPTTLFPDARPLGGVVWPTNDVTKPNGNWNYDEVKKSARYECEKCGEQFPNSQKLALLKTSHEFHRNPSALPRIFSLQVNAMVLPFTETEWGDIVVEFLKAKDAMKCGDIEPMIAFVTETLGEPWELRNEKQKESELLERCGDYKLGQFWTDTNDPKAIEPKTVFVITVDRQLMHVVYVIRQWRQNGQSRLVWCGVKPSMDEIREMQLQLTIRNKCVWADDGGTLSAEFRQTCLRNGWNVLKGEDYEHFTISGKEQEKSYRQGWRATEFDPGVGTTQQGRATMTAYLWSNPWFKDKLYNIFTVGKGPLWELPKDIPPVYVKELMANEWREKTRNDGRIEGYWHESGPDHFADCELEQLVVAEIAGITRVLPRI